MKFDTENCKNQRCTDFNYGYDCNCYRTSWASDPRNCEHYFTHSEIPNECELKLPPTAET